MTLFALAALATPAEMFFSSDKNGQNRVTNIQEGDEIWIAVYDPDQNIDCDLRDKMAPDLKIFDPKTGAYIVWTPDPDFNTGDYLEETGADTGLFVSSRAFQVGTRESYATQQGSTHVVDDDGLAFKWGHYLYADSDDGYVGLNNVDGDDRGWFGNGAVNAAGFATVNQGLMTPAIEATLTATMPSGGWNVSEETYLVGRFENMDTLVGMYQDPNDATDVAVTMGKIIDTEATISWDQEIYKDARGTATITVVDPDENLNCNKVEWVPVFIIVNPGSWNPMQTDSATNFCMLKSYSGVDDIAGNVHNEPIRWYNIYQSAYTVNLAANTPVGNQAQPNLANSYYMQYPNSSNGHDGKGSQFDTATTSGVTRVMFYAQETGVSTGVFQLNLNDLRKDLGFNNLDVRDVLVAYYLDPNDFDDFKLATAYIEERQHSITSFTNANRGDMAEYWIGRDPVYVQVIDANANVDPCCPEQVVVHICDVHGEDDAEWVILDETSSNSPVFFTNAGMQLWPVWDALGVGTTTGKGGYQLQLDNWKIEAFNEDSIYARYNDVYYETGNTGLAGLGDILATGTGGTAFPPAINRIRVANDVSFDMMEIADTQVFDGSSVNMYFLDRQGNRVSGYVNSDCVFVEVIDLDQDEDQYRRERIDGFWDDHQNIPFGPQALNPWVCVPDYTQSNSVNALLGDTNIFSSIDVDNTDGWAKLYVLNPRNGRWAAVDLLETGTATGDFVSVTCIDLVDVFECVPTLGVRPGDTIVAAYMDPSNHSDSSWISIKVGIGGGTTPPSQLSTTMFVDSEGNEVSTYTDVDDVYVKVIDPSHAGAASLLEAVEIDGVTYDLAPLAGATTDTFVTDTISLDLVAGSSITAAYTDPTDPTDTSSDTISIIASELAVTDFYAGPNPFEDEVTFAYHGTGIATIFTVTVYDLSGHVVWTAELANVTGITWNGTNEVGVALANGAYIYMVMATDGTNTFTGKGTVFINK